MSDLLVALDLGTTGVRALVVGEDGKIGARAYRPLSTAFPRPGWVEQDPGEMWESGASVVREALAQAGREAGEVDALGIVTQRSTVVAWDAESGAPLAPAIGWQDTRTIERVAGMRAAGLPITTLASATKIEWWLANDAAIQDAARRGTLRIGTPDAWLTFKATAGAAYVTDPGQASCTALFDPAAGEWAAPLGDLFGVPLDLLPAIVATSEVVGHTPRALFGAEIPVAARAGDQQASAFGQGVHEPGLAKLTLGTSAMLDVHTGSEIRPAPAAAFPLALWRLADGVTSFCLEGQVITAGAAVDWLVSLGVADSAPAVDRMARAVADTGQVVFVPALQGLGTPYGDEGARALFAGLSRGSSREQLARALLEGVAQRCVDLLDPLGVEADPLCCDGGLGHSDFLLQSVADFSGRPVARARETEATGVGVAWLAGLATGRFASPAACRALLEPPTVFEPALGDAERESARVQWQAAVQLARETV